MNDYYSNRLSGEQLRRCYEVAPPRVKRYLEAEIEFVLDKLKSSDIALELGCGYGRVLQKLISKAGTVVGVDTSSDSLRLARETLVESANCHLVEMDASMLGFRDRRFNMVICIQNGISAFRVDQRRLIQEAMRVTRSGGSVLFSSYSDRFWEERLEWFRIQSRHNLVGVIDEDATRDGLIVCKDGFKATTIGPKDFEALTFDLCIAPKITEVNGSSIFCEIVIDK